MLSEEDASLDLCLKQWAEEATGELRSVLLSAATRIRALTAENEALRGERDGAIARVNLSKDAYQMHLKDIALAGARSRGDDALARAESSEALVAELREKVERLTKALDSLAYPDGHLRGPVTDGLELRELDEAYQASRNGA